MTARPPPRWELPPTQAANLGGSGGGFRDNFSNYPDMLAMQAHLALGFVLRGGGA
jgi:hypothetical protein